MTWNWKYLLCVLFYFTHEPVEIVGPHLLRCKRCKHEWVD